MPRRKKVIPQEVEKPKSVEKKEVKEESLEVEPRLTKEEILKKAKDLGLFQENKALKQYEIILSNEEYWKL